MKNDELVVVMEDGKKYKHNESGDIWILTEDYNGLWYLKRREVEGGRWKTVSETKRDMMIALLTYYTILEEPSLEEKAKVYDELHAWYLWLRRRTHNGKVNKGHVESFLKGVKKEFEGDDSK